MGVALVAIVIGGSAVASRRAPARTHNGIPSYVKGAALLQAKQGNLPDRVMALGASTTMSNVYSAMASAEGGHAIKVYLTKLDPRVEARFRTLFKGSATSVEFATSPTTNDQLIALNLTYENEFQTWENDGIDIVGDVPGYQGDGLLTINVINPTTAQTAEILSAFGTSASDVVVESVTSASVPTGT